MMNYKEVLQSVGYPEDVMVLDFETYYDSEYSLTKMSTVEYILNSKFEMLGLGYYWIPGDKDAVSVLDFLPPLDIEDYLNMTDWNRHTCVVNNGFFDVTILKEKYGCVPKYIIDTKDLAKHYDARMSHKLKDLAEMFKLPPKGDTSQFKGLHFKDLNPIQWQSLVDYNRTDLEDTFEVFKILLPYLSFAEDELKLARHTLNLYLNPKIKFDKDTAIKLMKDMEAERDKIIKKSGHTEKQLSGNISFEQLLRAALPEGELPPTKPGKKGNMLALAKNDEGLRYLLNHEDEKVRNLVQARQAVKSWPLHIKRIVNLGLQARTSDDWLLRIPLNYYAGHTGRWGGTEGINTQNFGSTGRAGKGTHELIAKVRELLTAPDGYKFVIVDSAQIEARVLAWLAGQEDLIQGFANSEDIYSKFASRLFGVEVRKPKKDDEPAAAKILTIRRGFGKDAILGCGFGMGSDKFYERCLQNQDLRPLFDSEQYDYSFIDGLIKTYRSTYTRIPEFWSLVERCFKQVVKFPGQPIGIFYDAFAGQLGVAQNELNNCLLTFWKQGDMVCLQLPSGRILYYRHASIDNKGGIKWHWGNLWGGSITENIVQSVARDLLAFWILEFEKRSLPVVLHTHDEIVAISLDKQASFNYNVAMNIMKRCPAWATGIPLDAEGGVSGKYSK
jgi:DNA polymerase